MIARLPKTDYERGIGLVFTNSSSLLRLWSSCQKENKDESSKKKFIIFLALLIITLQAFCPLSTTTPITGLSSDFVPLKSELSIIDIDTYNSERNGAQTENYQETSSLKDFVDSITNGESETIQGIYSANEFTLPVV